MHLKKKKKKVHTPQRLQLISQRQSFLAEFFGFILFSSVLVDGLEHVGLLCWCCLSILPALVHIWKTSFLYVPTVTSVTLFINTV